MPATFNILSLDGGGSLGVYTLGILSELEAALDKPLHAVFDLIYGTSTGSIIASLLALDYAVEDIRAHYFEIVPNVMGALRPSVKTKRLEAHGRTIFQGKRFDAFKTNIGIVTTDLEKSRPMVFKSNSDQAHARAATFQAGFGCTIEEAVVASCSAYPFFTKQRVSTSDGKKVLVDGGFAANNPALLALTDAFGPLGVAQDDVRLLTLGTGSFPAATNVITRRSAVETFITLLGTNARTVDTLRELLFPRLQAIRIDQAFSSEKYRTNFLETDIKKLEDLYHLGRESYAESESKLLELLS